MQKTLSIRVTGKVQGVYYRQSAKEKAIALGITGHVQNERDGSVTIIATGTATQLEELTTWCRKGPSRAIVDKVVTEPLPLQLFPSFRIE